MWEVKFQIILILDFVKIKKNETTLQFFGKPAFKPNLCWGQILFVCTQLSSNQWLQMKVSNSQVSEHSRTESEIRDHLLWFLYTNKGSYA